MSPQMLPASLIKSVSALMCSFAYCVSYINDTASWEKRIWGIAAQMFGLLIGVLSQGTFISNCNPMTPSNNLLLLLRADTNFL